MGTRVTGAARISGTRSASISQGSRVRSYQNGRTCGHGACDTILSVYNPSKYCSVHEKLALVGRTRRIPRPAKEVACENCATVFETGNTTRKFCSDRCRMASFARRKRAAIRAEIRQQKAPIFQAVDPPADERRPVESVA